MSSLYELTDKAVMLQDMLIEGDIDPDTYADTLESLDIDTKVENVCKVIRNLEARAKMFKEEKDRMARQQKTAENGVLLLKSSLLRYLTATNTNKLESGIFKLSVGTSKAVNILDPSKVPEEYVVQQPVKFDKKAIMDDLKQGVVVDGAEITENKFVTIK